MGSRSTVYNAGLTSNYDEVSAGNKALLRDFITYCKTTDHSKQTCYQYEQQIKVFLCWVEKNCGNKDFTEVKKREFVSFFAALHDDYGMSPNRMASIKSALSSLSNYIEDILDDEYPNYRNAVKAIKLGAKQAVRPKTIMEEDEVQKCLRALTDAKKYEVACFFAFLVYSGARKSEAIQVRVDDFVDKNIVLSGKYWLTAPMRTKGRGEQGKVLRKYVEIAGFKPYLDLWMKQREELGIHNDLLFTVYSNGDYIGAKISTANSWAEKIASITGKEYYNHCIRHYHVSVAKRNGVPDTVIQKMIGWSSVDLVQVYDDRDAVEELEDWFKEQDNKDLKGE